MAATELSLCPLCHSPTAFFFTDKRRDYLRCTSCELINVPERFHLDSKAEKAEYDKHQNSPDDPGYRQFLSRLFKPLSLTLDTTSRGLDFGCGPGPALSCMFEEVGMTVALYDPCYFPESSVLSESYDFVCATEVLEHLRTPAETLAQMWACVRPGGKLGVMTKVASDFDAFKTWHYKNDPTHIAFYSMATLEFLARRWQARFEPVARDAFIFTKQST